MLLGFQSSVSASLTCKLRWCFEAIDIVHYVYLIRYLHNVYFYINAAMNFLIFWVWSPFPRSSNLVLVHVLVLITSNICKNNDLSLRKTFCMSPAKSSTSTMLSLVTCFAEYFVVWKLYSLPKKLFLIKTNKVIKCMYLKIKNELYTYIFIL